MLSCFEHVINMNSSIRLQLFTCLIVYTTSVHAIMVKFGTKGGPIEPPTPEPQPPPQPYRNPAPVWESRSDDAADPNAQWRPRPVIPQPRYTQVLFDAAPVQQPFKNVQRIVNLYKPSHIPIKAKPVRDYITPSQILSSQSLPGFGIRYFVPAYVKVLMARKENKKQEDAKHNDIETNDVNGSDKQDYNSDLFWTYEKDAAKRTLRNTLEQTSGAARPVYVWPQYVQPRH